MRIEHPRRIPFLILALATLGVSMFAGLARLGFDLPLPNRDVLVAHGPLMVSGFLGTLVGLERAVALGKTWGYACPMLTLAGAGLSIAFPNDLPGRVFMLSGSIGVVLVLGRIWWLHRMPHTLFLVAGSLAWVVGNALLAWTGRVQPSVLWWIGFLLLTIVGERLELNRILKIGDRQKRILYGAIVVFVAGVLLSTAGCLGEGARPQRIDRIGDVATSLWVNLGYRCVGLGMIAIGLWLARFDLARKNVKRKEIPRFVGWCLLTGFVWLTVCGALCLWSGAAISGVRSDAILHSFFVGFILTMVLGHAPIVFPAVLGITMKFRRFSYVPLVLLNIGLAVRVTADLIDRASLRKMGAMLNGIAIVTIFLAAAWAIERRREADPS